MQVRLRHVLIAIAIAGLAFLSHHRVLGASWLGDDRAWLAAATRDVGSAEGGRAVGARAAWSADGAVRPLAALVVRATTGAEARSTAAAGARPPATSLLLRVTAFVLLLAAAAAGGFALNRALQPWIGGDTARAAGFASALFVSVHPFATAALARPRAIGDLVALACGATAAWMFLRGRQQREKAALLASLVLTAAAGFASPIAVVVPFVLAALELSSTRRMRTVPERARTAFTTLIVYLAAVLLEGLVAGLAGVPGRGGLHGAWPDLPAPRELGACVANVVERLGILFLPVAGRGDGTAWPHYLLSVSIVLVALVPLLRGARAAPRLWGWIAAVWFAGTCVALVPRASVRVSPADFTHADLLLVAGWFACGGLAVAATAQLGTRRILLPALMALGFAWLGARAAGGFLEAGSAVDRVTAGVADARARIGPEGEVAVVDAPRRAGGLELGLDADGALERGPSSPVVRHVASAALPVWARTEEFRAARARGLALVESASPDVPAAQATFRANVIPPGVGDPPPFEWRAEVRSPLFERDLDPTRTRFARISTVPGASVAEAPRLAWRTGGGADEPAGGWPSIVGVWLAGRGAPEAVFDLSARPEWWRAASVRRVWVGGGLTQVDAARLLAEVSLGVRNDDPRTVGDDFAFQARFREEDQTLRGEARYVLELLDLDTLEFARTTSVSTSTGLGIDSDGAAVTSTELTFPGAAGFVAAARARRASGQAFASHRVDVPARADVPAGIDGPVRVDALVWSLERRVGEVALSRASGRIALAP